MVLFNQGLTRCLFTFSYHSNCPTFYYMSWDTYYTLRCTNLVGQHFNPKINLGRKSHSKYSIASEDRALQQAACNSVSASQTDAVENKTFFFFFQLHNPYTNKKKYKTLNIQLMNCITYRKVISPSLT